jgi:hypothetical protein
LTSKVSRAALIAAIAVGASGLVAVPAEAASFQTGTGLVNQPIITGASQVTPESAIITGAIDTGGYNQPYNGTGTTTAGGYPVAVNIGSTWDEGVPGTGFPVTASPITIDGVPLTTPDASGNPVPTFSGAWVEYDPVADFDAAGDAPGPETQIAPEEDVDTSTSAYTAIPPVTIGGYPAATAENNSQTPLTPNTQYVYWLVQQTDETTAATTINAFDPVDLYNFLDGSTTTPPAASGAVAAAGPGQAAGTLTSGSGAQETIVTTPGATENDFPAWAAGTGAFTSVGATNSALFNGSTGLTGVPNLANLANPDWSCQADYKLINGGEFAVNNPGEPWASYTATSTTAGGITDGNTVVPASGSNSSYSSSSGFNWAPAQPDEQSGSCVDFLGSSANQNYFVTSGIGEFSTGALADVAFGSKAMFAGGNKLTDTVQNKSAIDASGTVDLTVKSGKKTITVAAGSFKVAPKDTTTFTLKLTAKGLKDYKKATKLITAKILYTSNTDQPTKSKTVKF